MQITARVLESTNDIANKILQSILRDVKGYMSKVSKLQPEIRKIVNRALSQAQNIDPCCLVT